MPRFPHQGPLQNMSPSDLPGLLIVLFVILSFWFLLADFIGLAAAALVFAAILASGTILGLLLSYLRSR